ncbi:MAG: hypothetical protein Q7U04_03765 [Bacteriovorax sp.]|nr:hypothetical protein [Bacteriovorax sp.]
MFQLIFPIKAAVFIFTVFFISIFLINDQTVSAAGICTFDCGSLDCCPPSIEKPCSGGPYGGSCMTTCVGGNTAPSGSCPY